MKVTPIKEKDAEKRGRKASKETRQLQLIEATIDSLAKRGYSETTMADELQLPRFLGSLTAAFFRVLFLDWCDLHA